MTTFSFAGNPSPSAASQGDVIPVLSEASAHDLPSHRKLTARLSPDSTTIEISHGRNASALRITLHRTVRVPDNHDTNALPPSLGRFQLHQTARHAHALSGSTLLRGGLFVAMHDAEAAWLQFHAAAPFALKIHVGGVNAVSGLPMVESPATRSKRRAMLAQGKPLQDYLVVPGQRWLDGVVAEDGRIRQFVAKPSGSGFSVEAQVTGEDVFGGMQIEIIPARRNVPTRIEVRFSDRDDVVVTREVDFAARGITAESSWLDVKKAVRDEFDVAVRDQILSDAVGLPTAFASINFADETKLGDLYFPPTFRTLHVQYRKPNAVPLFGATVPVAVAQAPPIASPSLLPKSGLFGQSTFQSSFGSANQTQTQPNPFGVAQQSSGFGAAAPSTSSGPGIFGTPSPFSFGNTNTTSGLFGSSSSNSTTATPNTTSSCFSSTQQPSSTTGGSLFGVNTSRAATGLFSNPTAQQPSQTTGSLFGNAQQPSPQPGTGATSLFGSAAVHSPPQPLREMAIAAGGLIKQSVAADPHPADTWDVSASIMLNIQILDPASFRAVTGRSPHPPPTTMTGASSSSPFPFPFYALPGEQATGIKGLFGEVQSVSQLEAAAAGAAGLPYAAEASVPVRVVNLPLAPFCSSFRPVDVLQKEARATGFGV